MKVEYKITYDNSQQQTPNRTNLTSCLGIMKFLHLNCGLSMSDKVEDLIELIETYADEILLTPDSFEIRR